MQPHARERSYLLYYLSFNNLRQKTIQITHQIDLAPHITKMQCNSRNYNCNLVVILQIWPLSTITSYIN